MICNAQCAHGENLFSACKDTPFFSHEEMIGKIIFLFRVVPFGVNLLIC